MSKLLVHLEDSNEELFMLRKLRLTVGNKVVKTPLRSLKLKDANSESKIIKNSSARGMNTFHKVITKEKVDEILSRPESELEFGKKLNILSKPELYNELNFLIFSYENKNKKLGRRYNVLPSEAEIQKLCEVVIHPLSDVIIPPRIENLTGESYLEFLRLYFNNLKTHNINKSIIGYLPFVARNELIQLFGFYEKQGINSFIVDFDNHNPIDAYVTVGLIQRLTKQIASKYGNEVYLHAFNIPFTRTRQKVDVTPAKDIVTFMMGLDSYGSPHIPWKIPTNVVEIIKAKQRQTATKFFPWATESNLPEPTPQVFRIFNRKDYGYYRSDLSNLGIQKEENETVSLEDVYASSLSEIKQKSFRKAFNVERQAIEAVELQNVISEGAALEYLEGKKYGRDNFRTINKINKGEL